MIPSKIESSQQEKSDISTEPKLDRVSPVTKAVDKLAHERFQELKSKFESERVNKKTFV